MKGSVLSLRFFKILIKLIIFVCPFSPKKLEFYILAAIIPLTCILLVLLVVVLWVYKRRLYLYRSLSRLAATDVKRLEKLGEGHYGEVWKVKYQTGHRPKVTHQIIVVKMLKESATNLEEKEFREEALLLSKLNSEYVIRPIGICLETRPIMLGLEYINGGSVDDYLIKPEVRNVIGTSGIIITSFISFRQYTTYIWYSGKYSLAHS